MFLIDIYCHSFDKYDPRDNEIIEWKETTNGTSNNTSTSSSSTTTTSTTKKTTKAYTTSKQRTTIRNTTTQVKQTKNYKLTHYGPDCKGCSGNTASGYKVNNTIYYNDSSYGKLRIVAMCSNIPLYSVIKIHNYKLGGDVTAIVLDRGVGCSTIDLLVESERKSSQLGIQNNVSIDILRRGK